MAESDMIAYRGCTGHLSLTEDGRTSTASVAFDVTVDKRGKIHIDFQDQPVTRDNFWINRAYSNSSPSMAMLELHGVTATGLPVNSNSIILRSVRVSSTPQSATLSVKASAALVTVQHTTPTVELGTVQYCIAGLQFYHGARFEMSFGEVGIGGGTKKDDDNPMTGVIVVQQKTASADFEKWITEVEAGTRRMLGVLSFASGHILRANVREVFSGETLVRIEFRGGHEPASQHKPPLHFLNLANTFPQLAKAYDATLIERTGLDVAIAWHLMPHGYDEARFVAQMTAIEHLLFVFQKTTETTYLHKTLFKKQVVPPLQKKLVELVNALAVNEATKEEATAGIANGIRGANRRSLRTNLLLMLAAYDVPLDGLSDWIGGMIEVRNNIVHRGIHNPGGEDIELNEHVAAAEELIRRIVFALLGFRGQYTTWFGRIEDRDFCPAGVAIAVEGPPGSPSP